MDWNFSESTKLEFFLCSLRSGLIFGPVKVSVLTELGFGRIHWEGPWPGSPRLDEWEGYAVCVPSRQEVWGVCKPSLNEGQLQADMDYVCQPMPTEDRRIFEKSPRPNRLNK